MNILDLFEGVSFDESVVKYEYHGYLPYSSTTYDYNDEIRIPINKTDIYTQLSESFLYLEGEFSADVATAPAELVNNPYPFLFSEIRFELNGTEIDRVRNPGIASSLKGYASFNTAENNASHAAGWHVGSTATPTKHLTDVNACIPLKYLLGFFEDYKRLIINAKQELVLIRSRDDKNMYKGGKSTFKLKKLQWHVPHVIVNDDIKLQIYKHMEKDIYISFRQWELHELPSLKENSLEKWAIRTTTELEKPRYVIVGFQTNKKDNIGANASEFDEAKIRNIQLYLNTNVYPYMKYNLDFSKGMFALAYHDYSQFQKQYYGYMQNDPLLNFATYKNHPVFVIDCSKQTETVQSSSVDVEIEFESHDKFPANTAVYCLILHDTIYRYNPTTGDVRRES